MAFLIPHDHNTPVTTIHRDSTASRSICHVPKQHILCNHSNLKRSFPTKNHTPAEKSPDDDDAVVVVAVAVVAAPMHVQHWPALLPADVALDVAHSDAIMFSSPMMGLCLK